MLSLMRLSALPPWVPLVRRASRALGRANAQLLRLRGADIGPGAMVSVRASVAAPSVRIGAFTDIHAGTRIWARESIDIGDACQLFGFRAEHVTSVALGDYTMVLAGTATSGGATLAIGENSWIGEDTHLNLEAPLTIGSGVGIGAGTQVWTHGYFAEEAEGLPAKRAPVVIEDDVWITPRVVVMPGVTIGERALINTAAIVTRDLPGAALYAGAPAKQVNAEDAYRRHLDRASQIALISKRFLTGTGGTITGLGGGGLHVRYRTYAGSEDECVLVTSPVGFPFEAFDDARRTHPGATVLALVGDRSAGAEPPAEAVVFDLATKTYDKRGTLAEIAFKRILNDSTARFRARRG